MQLVAVELATWINVHSGKRHDHLRLTQANRSTPELDKVVAELAIVKCILTRDENTTSLFCSGVRKRGIWRDVTALSFAKRKLVAEQYRRLIWPVNLKPNCGHL